MDQDKLIALLGDLRGRLASGGRCIVITASYDGVYGLARIKRTAKDAVKRLLDATRLRPLGQFWGYARNRGEFQFAMNAAGFTQLRDGTLDTNTRWDTYWIEATKNG